jgi:hypothetical protein
MDGDALAAEGVGAPEADTLATAIGKARPASLPGLETFLAHYPECRGPRKERLKLLKASGAAGAHSLEALEDAFALFMPLDRPAGEGRDAATLAQTRQALAGLEERLARWPGRIDLWKAWIDWNLFIGQPVDAAALAAALSWPPCRAQGLESGPVPFSLASGVLRCLADRKRFKEADAWAGWIWRSGLEEGTRTLASNPEEPMEARMFPGMAPTRESLLKRLDAEFMTPWKACLKAQGIARGQGHPRP